MDKGDDFKRIMAELMDKATGHCHGNGGSTHIDHLILGTLSANDVERAPGCG